MTSARAELEEFASSQWGMFTTAQAQQRGVRRNQIIRLVDQGRVEPMTYGVYRYTAGEETAFPYIKSAWLSTNPAKSTQERLAGFPYDAVIANRTAAVLLGVGDFYASPYTFAVGQRRQTSRDDIRYLMRPVDEQDITFVESLPVTSFERTLYDLIRSHEDPSLVDNFIRDASKNANHYFVTERLAELLAPLAARNGYPKGDGKAFATDLLIKNSARVYVDNSRHAFNSFTALLNESLNSSSEYRSLFASISKRDPALYESLSKMATLREPGLMQMAAKISQPAISTELAESISKTSDLASAITTAIELNKDVLEFGNTISYLANRLGYKNQLPPS